MSENDILGLGVPIPNIDEEKIQDLKEKAEAMKKKPGRSVRRPDEDIPGADYVKRMEQLGPRRGESHLAHTMRLASIVAGRACITEHAKLVRGNVMELCKILRLNRHNLAHHLKRVGMTTEDILVHRPIGER